MEVSGLMRALLGAKQPTDAMALELKSGQVVRGVVLHMLADSIALMNIKGTTVRARLEIPLQQGQSTLMQVMPELTEGLVTLKPLTSSGVQIHPDSMPEVLQSLGLKDTSANRSLVKGFHSEGLPLTKETTQAAASLLQGVRPDDQEQMVKAAAVAVRRGLPLSGESVAALKAVMFGDGLGELLGKLEAEAEAFVAARTGGAALPAEEAPAQRAAVRLLDAIRRLEPALGDLLRGGGTGAEGNGVEPPLRAASRLAAEAGPAGAFPGAIAQPAAASPAPSAQGVRAGMGQAAAMAPLTGEAEPAAAPAGSTAASPASLAAPSSPAPTSAEAPVRPTLLTVLQRLGVDLERQIAKTISASPAQQQAESARPTALTSEGAQTPARESQAAQVNGSASRGAFTTLRPDAQRPELQHPNAPMPDAQWRPGAEADPRQTQQAANRAADGVAMAERPAADWADTLKSAALQLQSADNVPPALKEAAQQAVQWITGQQLLLAADRNTPFVYATLFIPFGTSAGNGEGEGTASVHIQSRKGKRGEWDAENCRLWFELRMKQMGATSIDVLVTKRIVSLHVFNDRPESLAIIEEKREAIEEALGRIGYRLSSVRTSPLPEKQEDESDASSANASAVRRDLPGGTANAYVGTPYKGVDIRI